jgi:hypothetical protein
MPGPLRWTLVGVVALLAVRPSRDLSRTLSIDSIYLERGFSSWAWAYLTSVHLGPRESPRRIGRREGLLRVRAGAQVPRRDADGCRRAVRQAGREAVQPSLGTRPLGPRSPQGRGRGLGLGGKRGLALNTPQSAQAPAPGRPAPAAWGAPGAPSWRAPRRVPAGTPAPGACLHTVRRRRRPARKSGTAARPHPLAPSAPSSLPPSPPPQAVGSPLVASALPTLGGAAISDYSLNMASIPPIRSPSVSCEMTKESFQSHASCRAAPVGVRCIASFSNSQPS